MSDTTFHTLDDIKTKASELGYDLVEKPQPNLFKDSVCVFTGCRRAAVTLKVAVVKENDGQYYIKMTEGNTTLMHSCGMDTEELIRILAEALENLEPLPRYHHE